MFDYDSVSQPIDACVLRSTAAGCYGCVLEFLLAIGHFGDFASLEITEEQSLYSTVY